MHVDVLPVSVVIPTRNRTSVLRQTLGSLAQQSVQPAEVKIVDASEDELTRLLCTQESFPTLRSIVSWHQAAKTGAATQRNQGVADCGQPAIGFMDDDILFEPECFVRLWRALHSDAKIGGVNAMITNQCYQRPGRISRVIFQLMAGRREASYAGRVLGPAVNLLPEDREDLPEVVSVEWLNTTCALYRREALPNPPFPDRFTGYSLMEDVALSLEVGKSWKLANARTARIYHNSQLGSHKSDPRLIAEMQLMNRYYVMTQVLGHKRFSDHLKLALFECFSLASSLTYASGRSAIAATLRGKLGALRHIAVGSA